MFLKNKPHFLFRWKTNLLSLRHAKNPAQAEEIRVGCCYRLVLVWDPTVLLFAYPILEITIRLNGNMPWGGLFPSFFSKFPHVLQLKHKINKSLLQSLKGKLQRCYKERYKVLLVGFHSDSSPFLATVSCVRFLFFCKFHSSSRTCSFSYFFINWQMIWWHAPYPWLTNAHA